MSQLWYETKWLHCSFEVGALLPWGNHGAAVKLLSWLTLFDVEHLHKWWMLTQIKLRKLKHHCALVTCINYSLVWVWPTCTAIWIPDVNTKWYQVRVAIHDDTLFSGPYMTIRDGRFLIALHMGYKSITCWIKYHWSQVIRTLLCTRVSPVQLGE